MELKSVYNPSEATQSNTSHQYWNDILVQNYYSQYFKNLTSKELDRDFNNDVRVLTHALSKVPETKRKELINILSRVIAFYLEKKIEKEIDHSFSKLLKH